MRSSIELLEPRIAPASLTGRVLSYVDKDGDKVTVTFTKGTLSAANFTFDTAFGNTGPQLLHRIDVSDVSDVEGSNITVKVKRAPTGDGVAHIGEIIATGRDLGAVKTAGDLAKIMAGNTTLPAPAIKSLSIGSYGVYDGANQAPGGNQSSLVLGDVPSVTILGDFTGGAMSLGGSVAKLKIGGSIVGGLGPSEGRMIINGNLTSGTIGGSIVGGSGSLAGQLSVVGNVGTLTIRGSLLGGTFAEDQTTAQLDLSGSVKKLSIQGDVRGPTGAGSHNTVRVDGTVGSLTIGGSVTAPDGFSVRIALGYDVNVPGKTVGSVLIKKSVQNLTLGVGENFGAPGPVTVDRLTINGAFIKSRIAIGAARGMDGILGTVDDTQNTASQLNFLTIKGGIAGTVGGTDSYMIEAGRVGKAMIGGRSVPVALGAQTLSLAYSGDVFLRDLL